MENQNNPQQPELTPIKDNQEQSVVLVDKQPASTQINDVPDLSVFSNSASFEHAQRVAKMLSSSDLIPQAYRGNIQNTMIALEMANRAGASPLMVMQNLHIIQGKPSWSSPFIIAAINSCGKFSEDLDFEVTGTGDTLACYAYTVGKGGKAKVGPTVTMQMAKDEGWVTKTGSKWKTMPELMIRYRAAAFFGRLYCPEIMMGMQTAEEVYDVNSRSDSPTVADLQMMYEAKKEHISPEEQINIERILNSKEEKSYGKLHKTLQAL